jgi:hypothetical protein
MALSPGLYECIVNHAMEDLLSKAREDHVEVSLATLDEGESHILPAQYMAGMIAQSLKKIKGKNKILNQIQSRLTLLNHRSRLDLIFSRMLDCQSHCSCGVRKKSSEQTLQTDYVSVLLLIGFLMPG